MTTVPPDIERWMATEVKVEAVTGPGPVHARGRVVAYCDVPSVTIRTADGRNVSWRADMVRESTEQGNGGTELGDDPADRLAKVREVVEYHGGTWRPDNPSLAVDNLVDAEQEKAEKVRGKLAEALQVPLDDRRHVHPRAMDSLIEFAGTILRQRDELTEFRDTVRGLLGHDYPPFTTASEIVTELRKRLQGPEDDGVVDVDIIDETSHDYAAGHWAALNAVALLLGHSRQYAAVMTPVEIGEAIRGLRHRGDRCAACPWTGTVGCGGAEGVCEGNVVPPVGDKLDLPKVGGGA